MIAQLLSVFCLSCEILKITTFTFLYLALLECLSIRLISKHRQASYLATLTH